MVAQYSRKLISLCSSFLHVTRARYYIIAEQCFRHGRLRLDPSVSGEVEGGYIALIH